MKFTIIAASLLMSSVAVAKINPGVMTFTAESVPEIVLVVTKGDAILSTGEVFTEDHMAIAKISSNVNTDINIISTGTWSDLTAFGGVAPENLLIQTTFVNPNEADTQKDHKEGGSYVESHKLVADVEHKYLVAVRTDRMTHSGKAGFQSIIQISAE